MVEFLLNNQLIRTGLPPGMPLLDFIRDEKDLKGTKSGCREGDCGACSVIAGEMNGGRIGYKTIVSCLTPLGSVHGKHIVTIEGLNGEALTPVQKAIAGHSGTQCGFCTPGFVISLTAHSLSGDLSGYGKMLAAIDGNICRCTGYKSIERAVMELYERLKERDIENPVRWLAEKGWIPGWFEEIPARLSAIGKAENEEVPGSTLVGGGTDLMVQRPEVILDQPLHFIASGKKHGEISLDDGFCTIGAESTTTEIMQSPVMKQLFPRIEEWFSLVASTPVRNMGTLAGNIVNASPIADLTIFFLALGSVVILEDRDLRTTEIPLKDFFTGYKKLKMAPGQCITAVRFVLPSGSDRFHFEKVSKREHLDIASVNSAMLIGLNDERIGKIAISAGGVAPVPLYLEKTCRFLEGKPATEEVLHTAIQVMQEEISPISDIRGSSKYKRLLLRQLFLAHFIDLFPGKYDILSLLKNAPSCEEH